MRHSFALAAVVASLFSASPVLAQVSYDSLMKQNVDARLALFPTLSNDNRTEIANTHILRWINKNRARLSREQIGLLEERMVLVTAELSGIFPKTQETADRFNDLQRRTARRFSWEDMRQATTMLHAEYIPKAP